MIESSSIKPIELTISLPLNGCSSRRVVHQGQLSEEVSRLVSLEIFLLSTNELVTVKLPRLDDVESIPLFSFLNHVVIKLGVDLLHSINHNPNILFV